MAQKLLTLLLLLTFSSQVIADRYRIIKANSSSITIGGVDLVEGDEFNDSLPITWQGPNQAIKALNLTTHQTVVISAPQMKKAHCSNLIDYLVQTNHMSVRYHDQSYTNTDQYLIDTLRLSIPFDSTQVTSINAVYRRFGKKFSVTLPIMGDEIIITRDMFPTINENPLKIDILCKLKDEEDAFPIGENIKLYCF